MDLKEWLELYGGLPDRVDMLEDNQGVLQNDVADLKVLGGLAPGDVNDATTANLIETKGSLTETALSAAIDGSLAVAGLGKLVSIPASMSMTTLSVPPITRLGAGRFRAAVDLQSMRPAPGVTYYVSPTGTDVADGLTPANPTTIKAAVTKEDVGTIMYAPGEYMRNEHFLSTITGKSINHIASGPGVKVTGWNNPGSTVWTRTSGNIYQTSRSATNGVVDVINRSEWGDYTEYVQKADLASITGPGQWAIVGSIVYAWAIGDTDFTVISNRYQIRLAMSGVTVGLPVSGGVHYVRGINYERTQISAISGALVIAEDVTIKHSLTDGVYVNGLGTGFIGNRVTVSSTGADGLSYTAGAEFIEIDCKAHHCGTSAGATTNNATTAHVGTKGIRLNGAYEVSGGPVVADVNDAKTWNLGCSSGGSTAPGPQDQSWRVDAVGYEATPATMWLDECTSSDATNAYKATGGGRLYLHATSESNLNATDSSSVGTIAYYEA